MSDDAAALRYLDDAVREYPAIAAINEEVENKRFLARARHALAAVLARTKQDATRAKALEEDALSFYRTASTKSYAWILSAGSGTERDDKTLPRQHVRP